MFGGRQSPDAASADTLRGHAAEVAKDPRMSEDLRRIVNQTADQATYEAGEYLA
jgi:hypothetical protein